MSNQRQNLVDTVADETGKTLSTLSPKTATVAEIGDYSRQCGHAGFNRFEWQTTETSQKSEPDFRSKL